MSDRTQAIADALLTQAVTLARLAAGEQDRVAGLLATLWRRVRGKVTAEDPTEPATLAGRLQRVKGLAAFAAEASRATFGTIADGHDTLRAGLVEWTIGQVTQALRAIGEHALLARDVAARTLARIPATALILGATAADWWGRQAATTTRSIADTLRRDVLQEQPLTALLKDLQDVQDATQRAADGLVETSLTAVHEATKTRLAATNSRALAGVQWLSTLDNRVCKICIALSGQAWTVPDHDPIGRSGRWPGEPPQHWGCRCTLIPIPRGETLAQDQTFDAWLKRQPVDEQQAILGPGRLALWQAGKLRLARLVDQRHRPLTLEQLRSDSAA